MMKSRLRSGSSPKGGAESSRINSEHKSSNFMSIGGKSGNVCETKVNSKTNNIISCTKSTVTTSGASTSGVRETFLESVSKNKSPEANLKTNSIKTRSEFLFNLEEKKPMSVNNKKDALSIYKYNLDNSGKIGKPSSSDLKRSDIPLLKKTAENEVNYKLIKINNVCKNTEDTLGLNRLTEIKSNKNITPKIVNSNTNETENKYDSTISAVNNKINMNPDPLGPFINKESHISSNSLFGNNAVKRSPNLGLVKRNIAVFDPSRKCASNSIQRSPVNHSENCPLPGISEKVSMTNISKIPVNTLLQPKEKKSIFPLVLHLNETKGIHAVGEEIQSGITENEKNKVKIISTEVKKNKKSSSASGDKGGKSFSSASDKSSSKGYSDRKSDPFAPPPKNETTKGDLEEKIETDSFEKTTNTNETKGKTEDVLDPIVKDNFDNNYSNTYISNTRVDNNNLNSGEKSHAVPSAKIGKDGKNLSDLSSAKTYESLTHATTKNKKHKSMFGIIWIPTRKNKKKNYIYQPHNQTSYKERSPTMYPFMSGDSTENQTLKKKPDDAELLVPEKMKLPVSGSIIGNPAIGSPLENIDENPERQELIKHEKDDSKEGAGDAYDHDKDDKKRYKDDDDDDDYLDNDIKKNPPESKWEKDKLGDKVDSVYLRPPPPHKSRSSAATPDEEDCGIKCLYYTLQCCDCVLM